MRTLPFARTLPRLLSPRQLIEITGLSAATIWRMRRRGELPAPIRLSPGRVGWPENDIVKWLETRDAQSRDESSVAVEAR